MNLLTCGKKKAEPTLEEIAEQYDEGVRDAQQAVEDIRSGAVQSLHMTLEPDSAYSDGFFDWMSQPHVQMEMFLVGMTEVSCLGNVLKVA